MSEYENKKLMTCPQCGREAHVVCGRANCVCHTNIPDGEKPLSHHWAIGPFVVSKDFGNWLWDWWRRHGLMDRVHASQFMLELERCPYCRFTQCVDFWFERSCRVAFP